MQYIVFVFFKIMRTDSLILLLVQKCLCVSISRGKPSIYFLLNIGYPLRPVVSRRRRPLSVRRPSRRRPSVHVRPSSSSVLCQSVRPVVRPVVVRPLYVCPVVRLNIYVYIYIYRYR